ncbi:TadE/TadG family type IV pilus assembly protein [uncultured Methylovirgula sp.]|uniref:TadE/TadG family type IV pilus assembly protein n=1 Tax=uncultured Methylovirgula sp. TaxID=1285960 RepID=UPI0026395CA5|nr:TadE/TadG family type IV pilus assembly protein [uncultured Methylovirgula sp.]
MKSPRKSPGSFARDNRASTAVEFAMIALPLLALILGALQAAIVLMAQQELEHAADEAGRLVMTGQVSSTSGATGYMTQAQFTNKVCSYLVALFNCSKLMINMQTASSFSATNTSAPSYTTLQQNQWSYVTGSHGQAPDVVILQVMYEWPIFSNLFGFNLASLPNGTRLLMATSVFKNEPSGS